MRGMPRLLSRALGIAVLATLLLAAGGHVQAASVRSTHLGDSVASVFPDGTSTWSLVLNGFTGYTAHVNNSGGNLSGTFSLSGGCNGPLSGTVGQGGTVNFTVNWNSPCTGEVTVFTGHGNARSASGTYQDNFVGPGTWTATRTG